MARKPLLIVNAGKTYPEIAVLAGGDFDDWIAAGLGRKADRIATVNPFAGDALPAPASCCGVIVTGSHAMVTDRHPWSEHTAAWIAVAVAADVPLLGICYGHQLLAHAMGGGVADNPNGREIGTVTIRLNASGQKDPLFSGLPETFLAQACHTQSVVRLPAGATLLAASAADAHHAFAVGRRAWGLQFHPEFDGRVLRGYIEHDAAALAAGGMDVPALLSGIRETPHSHALLRRFQSLCG